MTSESKAGSEKKKRVQQVYKLRDGRPTNWPHYRWKGFEVVDGGGFVAIHRYNKGNKNWASDEQLGFGDPKVLPHIIRLLQQAYRTRNWYINSEPPKWLIERGRKAAKMMKAGPSPEMKRRLREAIRNTSKIQTENRRFLIFHGKDTVESLLGGGFLDVAKTLSGAKEKARENARWYHSKREYTIVEVDVKSAVSFKTGEKVCKHISKVKCQECGHSVDYHDMACMKENKKGIRCRCQHPVYPKDYKGFRR